MSRALCFAILVCSIPHDAQAQVFDRENVELLSRLSLEDLGVFRLNDIWGWTDSLTGNEYAIVGSGAGTRFVDITNPRAPVFVGHLTGNALDVKTYGHYLYASSGEIFDLRRLRGVTEPQEFAADAFDFRLGAHNLAINEQSGYLYTTDDDILDLSDPLNPVLVGRTSGWHDMQVVNYSGPDSDFAGRELLFGSAGGIRSLAIMDVTDKSNVSLVSLTPYDGAEYTHQGWLSEDHRYFFLNDEFDDKWTHIFDVSDIDNPVFTGSIDSLGISVDHNLVVKGNYVYAANYTAGLRIFDITDPANGIITEVAYLDTFMGNSAAFRGAWGVYPFFDSDSIIVSDMNAGLFVAKLQFVPEPCSTVLMVAALVGTIGLRKRRC